MQYQKNMFWRFGHVSPVYEIVIFVPRMTQGEGIN